MTLRRLADPAEQGRVLAFADAPRRPWDSVAALRRRLDAYVPLLIDEAGEGTGDKDSSAVDPGQTEPSESERNGRRSLERLTDAKFLTHIVFRNLAWVHAKQRCAVLLLHNPAPDILDDILGALRKIAPFVPYSRIVDDLRQGRQPPPGFALTFDDGYKENMAVLDILNRHACKAMFFLNTATIDDPEALWFMNPDLDFFARKAYLKSLDYTSFLAATDREGLTRPSPLRGRFGLRSADVRTLLARGQEIGIHTHNDCELAVANAMAAVKAGANQIQGTINGYGERTGNCNLTSVIPILQLKMGLEVVPQLLDTLQVEHLGVVQQPILDGVKAALEQVAPRLLELRERLRHGCPEEGRLG